MTGYHVGCGATGIYAGTLNKKGDMWKNKTDVTDEAISSVAIFLLEHEEALKFNHNDKNYILTVSELKNEVSE